MDHPTNQSNVFIIENRFRTIPTKLSSSNSTIESSNDVTQIAKYECQESSARQSSQDFVYDDLPSVILQVDTFSPKTSSIRKSMSECCDEKSNDPFLYYSDDVTRMNTIKSVPVSENEDLTRAPENKKQRKTRISFEICPLSMMADILDEFTDDEDNQHTDEYSDKDDVLSQLFQM